MEIVIFKDKHITVKYFPKKRWIYADWHGLQTVESLMDGCEKILAAVKMYSCDRVISDTKDLTDSWVEVGDWLENDWFLRLSRSGVRYLAWVANLNSPDPKMQILIHRVSTWDLNHINWLVFENRELAEKWLREV